MHAVPLRGVLKQGESGKHGTLRNLPGETLSFGAGARDAVEHAAGEGALIMGEPELSQGSLGAARELPAVWVAAATGRIPPL